MLVKDGVDAPPQKIAGSRSCRHLKGDNGRRLRRRAGRQYSEAQMKVR